MTAIEKSIMVEATDAVSKGVLSETWLQTPG
jgi:hypothetical protein